MKKFLLIVLCYVATALAVLGIIHTLLLLQKYYIIRIIFTLVLGLCLLTIPALCLYWGLPKRLKEWEKK
jgi:hypothetical protein